MLYRYNRRSLRLPHYDYSSAGYYFVIIATHKREYLFGKIIDGVMVSSVAGEIVERLWYDISNDFDRVRLHDYLVPNVLIGNTDLSLKCR